MRCAIHGPGTWRAADLTGPRDWIVPFDDGVLSAPQASAVAARLWDGCGFAVLRGPPADEASDDELLSRYRRVCEQLGTIVPQTVSGITMYSVRDEGYNLERDYDRAPVRTSKTTAAFDFHTDSPSRLAGYTPDVIGLLVLRTARCGGESALVSGPAVHNVILEERPDLLERLYRPFWMDRRAELPPGEEPVLPVSVFELRDRLVVRYLRLYIDKGQQVSGVRLTPADVAALDYFEQVTRRPEMALQIELQRGDIQLVNNRFLLHSRTQYEDHPEPERKRHYVRVWIVRDSL
jgi:hypothetical protein